MTKAELEAANRELKRDMAGMEGEMERLKGAKAQAYNDGFEAGVRSQLLAQVRQVDNILHENATVAPQDAPGSTIAAEADPRIFWHRCEESGCTNTVSYDDEPKCFKHSPDSGASVPGYSTRLYHARKHALKNTPEGERPEWSDGWERDKDGRV